MKKEIILITGGSRSGKSTHALQLAYTRSAPRYYIATCPALDDEMKDRISRHRSERANASWITIEETIDLAGALGRASDGGFIVVDCLTLWISNLLFADSDLTEDSVGERCRSVLKVCAGLPGTVAFVANEVGMGVVPENAMARRFRDLAGRCNQVIAEGSDTVILMISGIPLKIK